jgi:hypothetical protein
MDQSNQAVVALAWVDGMLSEQTAWIEGQIKGNPHRAERGNAGNSPETHRTMLDHKFMYSLSAPGYRADGRRH